MSPHKGYMNIAIAAMLFAAAFAGVVFIADEDVAADGEPAAPVAVKTITYEVDGDSATRKLAADATTFIAPSLADLGLSSEKAFIQWELGTSAVFKAGQEYLVSALGTTTDGNVKLTAKFDENAYFKTADGTAVAVLEETEGGVSAINADVFAKLSSEGMKKAGFVFDGWLYEGKLYEVIRVETPVSDSDDAPATITVSYKVKQIGSDPEVDITIAKGMIFVAQYTPVYTVEYVVDGVVIDEIKSNEFVEKVEGSDAVKAHQPKDPVKANYTFMGWAVDGKIVSEVKAGVITIPADYKFETGTSFVAVFEPVQLTLTLVVGEFQTTQPALYGQKITAPGLPDGYSHWATMAVVDEKEVYTEFDFSQAIVENMTLYAQKAEKVYTISFISEGAVIGGPYDVSKPYTIPADPVVEGKKFVGWFIGDYKVADIKAYVAEHPDEDIVLTASFTQADAPAGPGFFETNEGKCVAVIIGVALLAFIYAVYTNMFGMKDLLTSFKIQRVKKE